MSARRTLLRMGRVAGFGALTAGMLPPFLAHRALTTGGRRDEVGERWVGAWCSAMLRLFGVQVVVHGIPPAPARGRMVVANHRSTADILVLLRVFGGRMVSRADLARWPLLGAAARAVGTVFVDRSNAVSGAVAVRSVRRCLASGATVTVFPEGTTFPGDDVRPFHAGAFVAARHSGAELVPAGLAYETGSGAQFVNESFPAHLARMAAAEPSHVVMCIGAPMTIDDATRAADLRDRAQVAVQRLVLEARRLVDGRG